MKKTYITPKIIFSKIENIGKSNLAGLDTKKSFNEMENIFTNMVLRINNPDKIDSFAASTDVSKQLYLNNYVTQLQQTQTNTYMR